MGTVADQEVKFAALFAVFDSIMFKLTSLGYILVNIYTTTRKRVLFCLYFRAFVEDIAKKVETKHRQLGLGANSSVRYFKSSTQANYLKIIVETGWASDLGH